jgi:plastocyanin
VRTSQGSRLTLLTLTGLGLAVTSLADAQPKGRPAPATKAEVDRLDKKIEDQQRKLDKLIKLQIQYLQLLEAMAEGGAVPVAMPEPKTEPKPPEPKAPEPKVAAPEKPRPAATPAVGKAPPPPPPKPPAATTGNIVGKVTGAPDAIIYVEDIVATARGTATMKQENKTFTPAVLVVQKGTTVQFPNLDAFFHNVFSVTPDNSFDLGSYRQGESKSVTMTKPGVVSVYCNMHPQMVGHILVVPSSLYTRAGADGFYRLPNVPSGKHKVIAWAPNAKPVTMDVDVVEDEVTTLELEVKKGRETPHLNKDGMPYGSYKD